MEGRVATPALTNISVPVQKVTRDRTVKLRNMPVFLIRATMGEAAMKRLQDLNVCALRAGQHQLVQLILMTVLQTPVAMEELARI